MTRDIDRRDFLALAGIGGLAFASGLVGCAAGGATAPATAAAAGSPAVAPASPARDFFFLQLSDTHWGFQGPPNPQADVTLEHAVTTINAVDMRPDFVVFTGDLTHTTDDRVVRRERMKRFRDIVAKLKVKDVRFLPGEHDAGPDRGEAYREIFGEPTYAFDHEGVYFVALDNVSLPGNTLGEAQLSWLEAAVARVPAGAPLVVLAHRPLFELYPEWDWFTKDGTRAIETVARRGPATVFYGHIHQEHHFATGAVQHHDARSLVFPLPAPGSAPKRAPLPWDPASPDHGLGWREIGARAGTPAPRVREIAYR